MFNIEIIRKHPDIARKALRDRQDHGNIAQVDLAIDLDKKVREFIGNSEQIRQERNRISKEISKVKDPVERQEKISEVKQMKDELAQIETELKETKEELYNILAILPNVPEASVPIGETEDENVVLRNSGEKRSYDFTPQPHWEIGTDRDLIDFERGVKLSGTRFYVLKGGLAKLQRALIFYLLDSHQKRGYTELYLPFMVREKTVFGAGQLPKFAGNLYRDHEEDYWMVPTAEVPITFFHSDEILAETEANKNYCAYTPCFRREKMSAGRDVRGIKRGHQFDKVELYKFATPDKSDAELEKMLADVEVVCQALELPYRIKALCTADLGFNAQKTYDVEIWSPGCEEWLEVSSISNCGDFQARRSNIRFRDADHQINHLHTLNGSALGIPRTMIAILESYQQADGRIAVPEVLKKYVGADTI